jgi:uncharacterized protein (DUF58 family)
MKKIITNNLWKTKEQKDSVKMKGASLRTLFSLNPHWINPLNISLGLLFAFLISSLNSRVGLVCFVSVLLFLSYNFLALKFLCKHLVIKRKVETIGVENDEFLITYIVENRSNITIEDTFITDVFEGTQKKEIISEISKIRAGQRKLLNTFVKLDNGMGVKNFNQLIFHITDVLGIFIFNIEYIYNDSVEVYPRIDNKDHNWSSPNEDTFKYGCYEIPKRGDSINFKGLREYQHGEPIKYINWLLSSKTGKLLINEFEKFVDSHVIVSLNTDIKTHIGEGAISTLEYAKDLSLLIASDQLRKGNELTLLTSQKIYSMGVGESQVRYLELILCSLELDPNLSASMSRFINSERSRGSTIIHLMPLHKESYLTHELDTLKKLSHENRKIILLTLDAGKFVNKEAEGDAKIITSGILNSNESLVKKIKEYIKGSEVFYQNIIVEKDPSFENQRDLLLKSHGKYRRIYG